MVSLIETPKNSGGINAIRTHDFRNAGAMLYQLSHKVTQSGSGQFVGLMCVPVKGVTNERNVYFEVWVTDER